MSHVSKCTGLPVLQKAEPQQQGPTPTSASTNGRGWSMRLARKCGIRLLESSRPGGRVRLREYTCICSLSNRVQPEFWGSEIASNPPTVRFEDVMKEKDEGGMAELTSNIVRDTVIVWHSQD